MKGRGIKGEGVDSNYYFYYLFPPTTLWGEETGARVSK